MTRKSTYLTVTDQFCGAGGSSLGAQAAGAEVRMAMNHWKLAIETHNTNFPNTDHDCADISASNPRRYPRTDILITSPECTNHALAKGQQRKATDQEDMFIPTLLDPAAERSRATMFDVVRFAEVHKYECIIVENVVDARYWILFESWLNAMHVLGYRHECVYLNSMFCHPTPQSRDRMYVIFWRKGNKAPRLDITPQAYCSNCYREVASVQMWKSGRSWGRYKRQYVYGCPVCAKEVSPYYYAALNALDLSLPAERIGDRTKALKPRTMARIQYGLDKYGRTPLVVRTNMTSGVGCRVRSWIEPIDTQPGSNITALVSPWIVETGYTHADETRVSGVADAMPTQTARQAFAAAIPPGFMLTYRRDGERDFAVQDFATELPTQVAREQCSVVIAPTLRAMGMQQMMGERVEINPSALLTMRDTQGMGYLLRSLSDALGTQVAHTTQDFLIARSPFLTQYYGSTQAANGHEAIPTVTAKDRHAVVQPTESIDVDDCYFRMLQPHEVGASMAFPASYKVLGNKREMVRQYGNAVTPPAMELLFARCAESLGGRESA